jgi:cyclic beta-1,2-glucan synthetase
MLLLQERIPKATALFTHTHVFRRHVRPASPRKCRSGCSPPRHADTRGAVAVERPLPRDGQQCRRRLQPLEGPRRDALARRRHPRQLGQLLLRPRRAQAGRSGPRPGSRPCKRPDSYEAIFSEGRAEFRRRDSLVAAGDGDFETHTEIVVSPEDDIELRRVRITNRSRQRREIDVTSYAEVVIAPPAADATASRVQQSVRPDRDVCASAGHPVHAPAPLVGTSRRPGCCT